MPSLSSIPHGVWLAMSVVEIICSIGLILPAFNRKWARLISISAVCIAAEMLVFSGIHIYSGDTNYGPMAYWLVVAAICAFIGYGRTSLKPL